MNNVEFNRRCFRLNEMIEETRSLFPELHRLIGFFFAAGIGNCHQVIVEARNHYLFTHVATNLRPVRASGIFSKIHVIDVNTFSLTVLWRQPSDQTSELQKIQIKISESYVGNTCIRIKDQLTRRPFLFHDK